MRWSLVAVGGVALAVAVGVLAGAVVVPGGAFLAPLAAAAAVVAGAWVAYVDDASGVEPLPAVETAVASGPPGARLNVALGSLVGRGHVELTPRGIRDALRQATVAVVVARDGVPVATAVERVVDGSWTPDAVASRFLADDWALPADGYRARLRRALGVGGDRPVVVAARRTADAVAARAGIHLERDRSEDDASPDGDSFRDAPASAWFPPAAGLGSRKHTVDASTDGAVHRGRTDRFRGVAALALVALAVGAFAGAPAAAFAGAVAVGVVAWTRATTIPGVDLAVSRSLSTTTPEPGEHVTVSVRVENVGETGLEDVRVVDGVPAALAVVDGSARAHGSLAPGESLAFEYVVRARRGVHDYVGALAVVRDRAGVAEERHVLPCPDELSCVPALVDANPRGVPLHRDATQYAGNVETGEGGDGLEFFQTRAYRRGDPLSRVDWNRFARTGDLATTTFREERAASVVLVVDGRAAGYVAPDPDGPHALDRAVDAAGSLYASLVASGNRVGLAAVSTSECWLSPGAGREHRERARDLLATNPALSPVPAPRNLRVLQSVDRLRRRIPNGSQIFFLTPLCDDRAAEIARRFAATGRAVTVVSPDPTLARTPSHRLARVGRRLRVTGLRGDDVRVVDWAWDEPLDVALARTQAGGGGR